MKIKDIVKSDMFSNIKKNTLILFVIYTFSLLSLFRANFNYKDDFGRVYTGEPNFDYFSRFSNSILCRVIHTGSYLTDISPLPQIIACFIIALAGGILIYAFSKENKFSWWSVLAIIPLGLSPYFLECFSYKYDSPYMAISILASVFPILFIDSKNWKYSIVTIISTIIMCTTYQASSGIFPMVILFYCFYLWNSGKKKPKELLKIILYSAIYYIIGLLVFKIFIMRSFDSYVSSSLAPLSELIPSFFNNIFKYYKNIFSDFRMEWLILIGIIIVLYVVTSIINSKQNKVVALIVSILILLVTGCLAFGIYPALSKTLFDFRAMYGFGAYIALIALCVSKTDKFKYINVFSVILSYCFIVFSFTYGNALQEQKRYTDFRIQLLISDLNNLEIMNNSNIKYIKIDGSIDKSPIVKKMQEEYSALRRIIPDTFAGGNWVWSQYYFFNYFNLRNVRKVTDEMNNLPVLKDTMYHRIESDGINILITLK